MRVLFRSNSQILEIFDVIDCVFYVGFEVLTAVSTKMAVSIIRAMSATRRPDDGGSKDL
jgi:hypothetical protein